MKKIYRTAAFDLDGTIIDTSEGVLMSVQYAVEKFGYEKLDEVTLRSFIGPPIYDSFEKNFSVTREKAHEMVTVFRERYRDWGLFRAVPYDGIYDVFGRLRDAGITPVIATYKMEDYAVTLLKHFGFDRYTDIICGSDAANTLTKGEIIGKAISLGGAAEPGQAVMIGDSCNDAVGAEAAGTDFLGVTYGFGFASRGDVDKFVNIGAAASPAEIADILIK